MPIDASIALGVKPMQVKSQGEYLNELYNQQNAEQSNQLNMMKMQAMNREIADSEAVKNYFATTNRDDPNFAQGLSAISPKLGMDYDEYTAKIATQKAAAAEHTAGTAGKKLSNTEASVKLAKAAQSDILEYPSEAMVTSYYEDAKRKGYFDPETLANIERFTKIVLSVPAPIDPTTGEPDFTARRQAITRLQLEAKDRLGKNVSQQNVMVNGVPTTRELLIDPITSKARTVEGSAAPTYNKPAASNTFNVSASTEKKYGEVFGGKVAEADSAMRDAALTAPKIAANANDILNIVNTGKFYSGTGADIKLGLAKFLNMAGKDDAEKIVNTQNLIKGQGQATLSAIKSSGLGTSQGFTDKDLAFLQGITGGSITLNAENIREFAIVQHKAAKELQKKWAARRNTIPKDALAGTGIDQETYDLPAMVQPPKGTPAPASNAKLNTYLDKYAPIKPSK